MTKSPNRLLGTVFGAFYILVGLLGFTVTSGKSFFSDEGGLLFGMFEVNMFHNIAHILIGAALLYAGLKDVPTAKRTNVAVGGLYLLLGIIGLFLVDSDFNILALNSGDNILHFASALLLLGIGLGVERDVRNTPGSNRTTGTGSALTA